MIDDIKKTISFINKYNEKESYQQFEFKKLLNLIDLLVKKIYKDQQDCQDENLRSTERIINLLLPI